MSNWECITMKWERGLGTKRAYRTWQNRTERAHRTWRKAWASIKNVLVIQWTTSIICAEISRRKNCADGKQARNCFVRNSASVTAPWNFTFGLKVDMAMYNYNHYWVLIPHTPSSNLECVCHNSYHNYTWYHLHYNPWKLNIKLSLILLRNCQRYQVPKKVSCI